MICHKKELGEIGQLRTKDIHEIIYKSATKNLNHDLENIYTGKNTKLISLNYRIATDTLKTAVNRQDRNRACIFCRERNETVSHLFFDCPKLKPIRQDLLNYTEICRTNKPKIDWNYLIYMKNLKTEFEYEIISLYKKVIWSHACEVRFNNITFQIEKIRANYEKDIQFYLQYIYN